MDEEESEIPVPYIIVRLNSGGHTGNYEDPNKVNIVLIVCIWDDGLDNEGHISVMNILQKYMSDLRKIIICAILQSLTDNGTGYDRRIIIIHSLSELVHCPLILPL